MYKFLLIMSKNLLVCRYTKFIELNKPVNSLYDLCDKRVVGEIIFSLYDKYTFRQETNINYSIITDL